MKEKNNQFLPLPLLTLFFQTLCPKLAKRGSCPRAGPWKTDPLCRETVIMKYLIIGLYAHWQYIQQFRLPFVK